MSVYNDFNDMSLVHNELCNPIREFLAKRNGKLGMENKYCPYSLKFNDLANEISNVTKEYVEKLRTGVKIGVFVAALFAAISLFFAAPMAMGLIAGAGFKAVTLCGVLGAIVAPIAITCAIGLFLSLKKPRKDDPLKMNRENLKRYITSPENNINGLLSCVNQVFKNEIIKTSPISGTKAIPLDVDSKLPGLILKVQQLQTYLADFSEAN